MSVGINCLVHLLIDSLEHVLFLLTGGHLLVSLGQLLILLVEKAGDERIIHWIIRVECRSLLEKAAAFDPNDPVNYALIASLLDEEYQKLAQTYQQMPASQQKEDMLKRINEQMDKTIDAYAHAVGLSTGRPEYQELQNQALQSLAPYYKYRHNQSIEGLQPLIDKYKMPAKP